MMEMEEIFFSGTFGGELLSLAAARTVLQRQMKEDVCGELSSHGLELSDQTERIIAENGLEDVLKISGHPSWRFLNWKATGKYWSTRLRHFSCRKHSREVF